ncbi:response regulator transcription factor [Candidatus Synechococcus calcipolaris G9]|uniref:Response regulator transcription factor n=1 Tax=Candidatus Synechococcus calcipolaris G9 TaxID=1497997 RepID=A0ABT6EZ71_9SYNE|nr:response regulator transcription factor [Candidatus Synechococcus calcipolaris]MDG2990883.1 response regulator transcription factor [Candidatus Synechococcus calcipolaris G9]
MEPTFAIAAPRILLVMTDSALAQQIGQDLQQAGYDPVTAATFADCQLACQEWQPALVIVDDLAMEHRPDNVSGLDLCRKIRQEKITLPLLLIMESDRLEDRVNCLEAGADDYLLKPYRDQQFLDMVQLYLKPTAPSGEQLRFETLVLDLATRRAERNGRLIDLTMKEYELLKFLMEHPRQVLSRDKILENVWGYDFLGESNVIEVYVRYLRLKIEPDGEKRLIHTVRGVGYVLREA